MMMSHWEERPMRSGRSASGTSFRLVPGRLNSRAAAVRRGKFAPCFSATGQYRFDPPGVNAGAAVDRFRLATLDSGMPLFENTGKLLMLVGGVLFGLGAILTLTGKVGWLGRLPGDFHFQRGNFSFYFPLATSILLSLLLTLILSFLFRRR